MKYVYRIEARPDAKKLGLKLMIGHAEAYFDKLPSKKKMLKVFWNKLNRRRTNLDKMLILDLGGKKLLKKDTYENKVFQDAVMEIISECNIKEDTFKDLKWSKKDRKEFSLEERKVAMVSIGCPKGRLHVYRHKVWAG